MRLKYDAPHTGARLETIIVMQMTGLPWMPPTRGHDLKLVFIGDREFDLVDAPHTGARLETFLAFGVTSFPN